MNTGTLRYEDINIIPEVVTDIESRIQTNPLVEEPYDQYGNNIVAKRWPHLPIFAAPMTSIVSTSNLEDYNKAGIVGVLPRSMKIENRIYYAVELSNSPNFVSFSMAEAENIFAKPNSCDYIKRRFEKLNKIKRNPHGVRQQPSMKICIDIANGHMNKLYSIVRTLKSIWADDIVIMAGNISNPKTYRICDEVGLDFIRCGIGSGNCCKTKDFTGVHMPMFTLIKETYEVKKKIGGKCKIIADGGIEGYGDIQKALIYADYVMIGTLFGQSYESSGKAYYGDFYFNFGYKKIRRPLKSLLYLGKEIPRNKYQKAVEMSENGELDIIKEVYGMSTERAQAELWSGDKAITYKPSEGEVKYVKAYYHIDDFARRERGYLASAMSYTNSKTLDEYKQSSWRVREHA